MSDDDSGIFTLATQGSITLSGNVLGKILGFVFVAVSTRLLSKADFGLFTLGLSIVTVVQALTSLNIYRAVDYFVPLYLSEDDYGKAKATLQNAFIIGITTSILGGILLFAGRHYVAAVFNNDSLATVLFVFALLIPVQTAFRTVISSFNSIKNMAYRALVKDILSPFMRIIFGAGLVIAGAGVTGLVAGYIVGIAIAMLFGIILFISKAEWLRSTPSGSISNWSLVSYSLPLAFAGIINSLVGQIDYFVIGYFLTTPDVAQYRVSYLLASNLWIVLSAISPIFKPTVAENEGDALFLQEQYQLTTRWVTMATIPLAATLIVAPQVYLAILFTDEFALAGVTVAVLTVGYLLNASFGPGGMFLEGAGYTKLTLFNTLLLVSVNSVLNIILVPRMGILGAGIATGTALTVLGAAEVCEIYLFRSVSPFNWKLLRVWIAAVVPFSVGVIVRAIDIGETQTALLLPVVISSSYLIGLHLTGSFSDDDRAVASKVDDRLGYRIVYPLVASSWSIEKLLQRVK